MSMTSDDPIVHAAANSSAWPGHIKISVISARVTEPAMQGLHCDWLLVANADDDTNGFFVQSWQRPAKLVERNGDGAGGGVRAHGRCFSSVNTVRLEWL